MRRRFCCCAPCRPTGSSACGFSPLTQRPVIVYFVYLLLLAGWWATIQNRVTQRSMRSFLLAQHAIMLFGITLRFVQDALLYRDIYLMRVSGYLVVIPLTLLPLLGLYASFGLGKPEQYRMRRKWLFLLVPTVIFIFLTLTNEGHHLVFLLLPGETGVNLFFHPNAGVYAIAAWALMLELARIVLIYRRSRRLEDHPRTRIIPFLIAIFMVALSIFHLAGSFVVPVELIEYTVFLYFLEAMVWESCILVGMVPVNTQYGAVFDQSTIAMQIVDEAGRPFQKSAGAGPLPKETFARLMRQETLRSPEGRELHLHPIRGGYAVWQADVSQTLAAIDALTKSADKLEQEGELLRQELKVRSDEAAVREQNRIYNRLTAEVGEQLRLLQGLLAKREQAVDKAALFWKICLVGTYVKRRCNLRLALLPGEAVPGRELELCYAELAGCLQEMGVQAQVFCNEAGSIEPGLAFFSLDVFQFLLEYEGFGPRAITVAFEGDTTFSIKVCRCSTCQGPHPAREIGRLGKEKYDIRWQDTPGGYVLSIRLEGN